MKRFVYISLTVISFAVLSISCAKEVDSLSDADIVNPKDEGTTPAGQQVTITATISDALTKVTFTPGTNGSGKPMMDLTWESGDKLRIADHADNSSYSDFELNAASVGQKKGVFTGNLVSATSYDVWVLHEDDITNMQVQASDGDASHIEYIAQATNLAADALADFTFTEVSSVLGLQAKLPADVAGTITSVVLTASENIFFGGKTLTLGINDPGDTGGDDILNLYATLPSGSTAIPNGTTLFVKFNSNNKSHSVYTAYRELGSGLNFASGALNNLKMNCVNTDKYAGKDDDGTSAHPYLIADPYQVASINGLAAGGQTTYFKMIADVDMAGVTHTPINDNSGYTQCVNFDGNNKTISHLGRKFFYVFKGSIQNLTMDNCSVTGDRAIFADYVQGTGHSITNVDVTNSSFSRGAEKVGALLGIVNSGSSGVTSVTISDCDIVNTNVTASGNKGNVGALIGFVDAKVMVDNCTVSKHDSGTYTMQGTASQTGGLIGHINTGNAAGSSITNCTVSGINVTGTGVVGGVIGYANAAVTISGCTYTGGTVTASATYSGGFIGSVGENATSITDCHVTNATITTTCDTDARCGGFIGQLGHSTASIHGCSVGTEAQKVTVNLPAPASGKVINSGGFAGTCYGSITKNGDVRSKAYVNVYCASATSSNRLNIGGFIGYLQRGPVEYCDADVVIKKDASNALVAQYIGGFVGYITNQETTVRYCTETGTVTGTNYTGGFVGYVDNHASTIISNCSSAGTVAAGSSIGGFAGYAAGGTFEKNTTSCTSSGASNTGAFMGQAFGSVTITKCSSTGESITATGHICGGLVGLAGNGATISDCYSTSNVLGGTRKRGGIIGQANAGTVNVTRSYATGNINGQYEIGGLVGHINVATFTMSNSAAWNGAITASSYGSENWSSGFVSGVTFPTCTLTDNYRGPGVSLTAYWVPDNSYQHANVSSEHPLVLQTGAETTATSFDKGQDGYPRWPYHGKCDASKTLPLLASTTLGWSSEIWDFTGDLPTLK